MNKRLLVCLLVLVFLGGLALSGHFIFRVSVINLYINDEGNHTEFIPANDKAQTIMDLTAAAAKHAEGKNVLFSINRKKIAEEIEQNKLIRANTDRIVAKFPNKLEIMVQERYPMYYINNGYFAVFDWELHVINISNKKMIDDYQLINIGDWYTFEAGFGGFAVGDVLDENDYTRSLLDMGRIFFNAKYIEKELCHMIKHVDFTGDTMTIEINYPNEQRTNIIMSIRNFKNELPRKLHDVWYVFENVTNYQPGTIIAEDERPKKLKAMWIPDGGQK